MANCCSIEAEIVCFDNQDAETLYQKLLADKTDADKRKQGFYIGSDRYFFDSIIEFDENVVTLTGSVKWGFTNDEILAFIKHLKKSFLSILLKSVMRKLDVYSTGNFHTKMGYFLTPICLNAIFRIMMKKLTTSSLNNCLKQIHKQQS